MDINIGILYASLHNQLRQKFGVNSVITRKEFFCKLGKHYFVPKNLKECVIKEMESRQLIKREGRDDIRILDCDIDLEKDANKFYSQLGVY